MKLNNDQLLQLVPQAFEASNLPLPGRGTGKVRDWYPFNDRRLLLVTTDRLSAFDRVLSCVPYKGQVLNQLSAWWFDKTSDIIDNHLISIPDPNAMLVAETEPFPVEVIVRGYITGVTSTALWYRYSLGERDIYGYHFPEGLRKNEILPHPIITPTTKGGPTGHDERLTCSEVVEKGLLPADIWDQVQTAALAIFKRGQDIARQAGLILVDTKYEFGRTADGRIVIIDEIHTPDASRFWTRITYHERLRKGREPENFDKEFVRLAYADRGYRGDGPPPVMPDGLWVNTSRLYIESYELLTGQDFIPGEYPVEPRLGANLKKAGLLQ
jgi:phosphoribosylaminoimidazole-succinocarboxamide synthase